MFEKVAILLHIDRKSKKKDKEKVRKEENVFVLHQSLGVNYWNSREGRKLKTFEQDKRKILIDLTI